ncbi:MAG: alpha/beta hydrolase [Bacteroidales bacterium]|nr:alpha/beta hydrolase [Bacteroidales bacterium]MBO7764180.1 alpha/beta hydrolase [Bacteroidales bacterium]
MEFFATSNGIPVHISDTEKGDITILLLHGYLETLYVWEDFISLFPKNIRFISIDLPGHGLTGSHPHSNSMEFCVEIIKGAIDKCSVSQCYVAGHSLGGYISFELQKRFPDLIKGIIMINTNTYADSDEVASSRDKEINFILSGRHLALASIAIPNMFKKENLRRMDDKIQEIIEIADTHDPEGLAASVRGMASRVDNTDYVSSLDIPVIAFFGDSDQFFPLDQVNKLMASLPKAECHIVPDSGHDSYLEEPQFVADRIINFVTKESC